MVIKTIMVARIFSKRLFFFLSPFIMIIGFSSSAQCKDDLERVECHSEILKGELSNGFSYYIKPISNLQHEVQMTLIHKAGSNVENEQEFDFAHAIEHLAFKGTINFPDGILNSSIIQNTDSQEFLIDGSSGRRQTNYNFNIVDPKLSGLDAGLIWFRDITSDLALTNQNIESVRAEVREEFLEKNGLSLNKTTAKMAMYNRIFPCEKSPVDLLKFFDDFSVYDLKNFYRKWYRPELFTLVITGDINDPLFLEKRIKDTFNSLVPREGEKKLSQICDSLYNYGPGKFIVVNRRKDSTKAIQESKAELHLYFRNQSLDSWKKEEIVNKEIFEILYEVLANRLREAFQQYNYNPVLAYNLETFDLPGMEVTTTFKNGMGKETVEKIMIIVNQLRKHGVSSRELEKVKKYRFHELKGQYKDLNTYWRKEISDFVVKHEALPPQKSDSLFQIIENITIEQVNDLSRILFSEKEPQNIGIIAPEGHDALNHEEEEVRHWIADIYAQDVDPYNSPEVKRLLTLEQESNLNKKPIVPIGIKQSGAQEYLLGNGIKLVLKEEHSQDPEDPLPIDIHGFSLGGVEFLPEEERWSGYNAPRIVSNSGVNGLDKYEMNRILQDKNVLPGAVMPYIDYSEHGIYGRGDSKNMETIMELIYLFFTRPNENRMAFEDWLGSRKEQYLNFKGSLYVQDYQNNLRLKTGDPFLRTSLNRKSALKGREGYYSSKMTRFEDALDIYKRFFGNAQDFTFLITGEFNSDQILSLAQKYLGNLPTSRNRIVGKEKDELGVLPKLDTIFQEDYMMHNISYGTNYIVKTQNNFDWKEHLKVEALGEVIRQKLWNLRFKKGYGIYNANARGTYNLNMQRYEISTYLFCQPKDIDKLQNEISLIVSDIKASRIQPAELDAALDLLYYFRFSHRAHRVGVHLQRMFEHYRFNQPFVEEEKAEDFVKNLTVEDISEVAKKYLKPENLYQLVIKDY